MIESVKHDLAAEGLISCAKASRSVPALDGKAPHPSTIFRWMMDGVRGVRLEHVNVGRKLATSKPALHRFFAALAEADTAPRSARKATSTTRGRTDRQREADVAAAEKTCAAMGV